MPKKKGRLINKDQLTYMKRSRRGLDDDDGDDDDDENQKSTDKANEKSKIDR